jgi:hypothetical protein
VVVRTPVYSRIRRAPSPGVTPGLSQGSPERLNLKPARLREATGSADGDQAYSQLMNTCACQLDSPSAARSRHLKTGRSSLDRQPNFTFARVLERPALAAVPRRISLEKR